MHPDRTIGIVGGTGWLGRSMAEAILSAGLVSPSSMILSSRSGRSPLSATWPGIVATSDNATLAARADVIILSVRPEQFGQVMIDAGSKLVISVMAGVPVRMLRARTGATRIVRAMPSAAVETSTSYTPWYAAAAVSAADRSFICTVLETFGTTDEVPREQDIDILTGLTGSGAAFPALLATAMTGYARDQGILPDIAERATASVMAAAAGLSGSSAGSIEATLRRYLDYDGTTTAALKAMTAGGFEASIMAGLTAAEATVRRIVTLMSEPDCTREQQRSKTERGESS